jgi:hypothetical protein
MMFIEKTCNVAVVYGVIGIEIPGIHFQDQKYSNHNVQTIKKVMKMSKNIQSLNEQNVDNL